MLARILVNLARSISTYIYKSVQQFEYHEQNIIQDRALLFLIKKLRRPGITMIPSIAYLALIEVMAYRL